MLWTKAREQTCWQQAEAKTQFRQLAASSNRLKTGSLKIKGRAGGAAYQGRVAQLVTVIGSIF